MATKQLMPNLPEFRRIKNRVSELYENSGDTIRAKKTVYMAANVLSDMKFLVDEGRRLCGSMGYELPDDVKKVGRFVRRVCDEQANAIKGGQFIKVNASIFKTVRFLVREVEKIILAVVDDDDGLTLRAEKMTDEGSARIELDVTDILGVGPVDDDDDDDDDDERVRKPVSRVTAPAASAASREPMAMAGVGVGTIENDDLPNYDDAPPG